MDRQSQDNMGKESILRNLQFEIVIKSLISYMSARQKSLIYIYISLVTLNFDIINLLIKNEN